MLPNGGCANYGVRRQSGAATALWDDVECQRNRSRSLNAQFRPSGRGTRFETARSSRESLLCGPKSRLFATGRNGYAPLSPPSKVGLYPMAKSPPPAQFEGRHSCRSRWKRFLKHAVRRTPNENQNETPRTDNDYAKQSQNTQGL